MIALNKPLTSQQIVIDVDTQRHFITKGSKVCVQNVQSLLANIRRVFAWTRVRHIPVVSTIQISAHNAPCCGSFWKDVYGLSKINGTLRHMRMYFEITSWTDRPLHMLKQYDQIILPKRRFNPFEEPLSDRILTELDADEFILVGTLAEGAILATALGLLARSKNVTVLRDATGTLDRKAGRKALDYIRTKGANVIQAEKFLGHSALDSTKVHC